MNLRTLCILGGAANVLSGAAFAQNTLDASQRQFEGVDAIVISDFTGRVIVEIGGEQTSASLQSGTINAPFEVSQNGSSLVFEGEERSRKFRISEEINWRRYGEDAFEMYLADYPTLRITTPAGTALELDDVITIAAIGDLNGDLIISGGYVDAVAGDVMSARVGVHGSGDIVLSEVCEALRASVHGSGDISAETAGSGDLSIHGSGDISVGAIDGDADLNIHGSGDIETGDIDGDVTASIHGSGDINGGAASRSGEFSIYGSGDISMRSINGAAEADIFGSGNIEISSGRAESLNVNVNGSGDFVFGGVSTDLVAHVRGSGGIDIARNEGTIRTSGRGDIRVGGIRMNKDD